ncbi:MAG: hypothetical protein LGB72_02535 [Sulfurovum sp.]|nr:hypothetical protein [Sulfurovum sp.]
MATLFDMDNKIKLAFYEKEGNDFEHFIVNLYKIKYPSLKTIKPQGAKGDGANDGYLSRELLLQVYAPERMEAKKAIEKLEHDLERAIEEGWKFKTYHFVINDKFKGGLRDIHHKIDELREKYNSIDIELIDTQTLKNLIYDLQVNNCLKIHALLGMDKDISKFGDFETFEIVIDVLSQENAVKKISEHDFKNFSKEIFRPDGIKKIEINITDEHSAKVFGTYIDKSSEIIEDFKNKVGLDEFGNVGNKIQKTYYKYNEKYLSEESLSKTHKELYSKMKDDRNLETSLWLIIAYFFDICEIGEIGEIGEIE